jgi:uncharacterized membrane protein YkvA (DUF1232 family)
MRKKAAIKQVIEMAKSVTESDIAKIAGKINSFRKGRVAKVWDKVTFLWNIARNPKEASFTDWAKAVAALLYLISPVDAVPDAIPIIGFIDDVAVILFTVKNLIHFFKKTQSS